MSPPRVVIFDLYRTLLAVGPAPDGAGGPWSELCRLHGIRGMPWPDFQAACADRVCIEHAAAKARGVAFPEVQWPAVVGAVLPDFHHLDPAAKAAFVRRQMQLQRATRLAPGAGPLLAGLHQAGGLLGLASNAQAYSLDELDEALTSHGLHRGIFDPALSLFSFELGFSKPEPCFFRILEARLTARGVSPGEILMVGDREDNDIRPAAALGWRTHHHRGGRIDIPGLADQAGASQATP